MIQKLANGRPRLNFKKKKTVRNTESLPQISSVFPFPWLAVRSSQFPTQKPHPAAPRADGVSCLLKAKPSPFLLMGTSTPSPVGEAANAGGSPVQGPLQLGRVFRPIPTEKTDGRGGLLSEKCKKRKEKKKRKALSHLWFVCSHERMWCWVWGCHLAV